MFVVLLISKVLKNVPTKNHLTKLQGGIAAESLFCVRFLKI
jgi:hypothetical protein